VTVHRLWAIVAVAAAATAARAQDLDARIDASVEKAKNYILGLQKNTILVMQGDSDDIAIDRPNPAITRTEVEGRWIDVVVDKARRSIKIKGRTYDNVYAVLPPGWFGPAEWVQGEPFDSVNVGGHTALLTLALLSARADPRKDPRVKAALDCVLNMHMRELGLFKPAGAGVTPMLENGPYGTYALGLRGQVFDQALRFYKTGDVRIAINRAIARDLKLLQEGFKDNGGYTYVMQNKESPRQLQGNGWDMSNTQYGLLGLWGAALTGAEVDLKVLEHFNRFFIDEQGRDGGWGQCSHQTDGPTTPTLTAAGLASLFVLLDLVHTRTRGTSGPDITPFDRNPVLLRTVMALDRGLERFGKTWQPQAFGYLNYGVERVGVASGYKYIGVHDWFKAGAEALLAAQRGDGSWPPVGGTIGSSPPHEAAWNLLFLVHGRAPVVVNKLQYGPAGDWQWNNYPRDAANLARFHDRRFEQEVNWQIVKLVREQEEDLHDAPVLYVSGYKEVAFTDEETDRLRRYVDRGGTLMFVTDGGIKGKKFTDSAVALAEKLYPPAEYPEYRLTGLPKDHPVYTLDDAAGDPKTKKVSAVAKIPVWHMNNGHRSFAFVVPEDVAYLWHTNRWVLRPEAFALFNNIRMHAVDRGPLPAKLRPPITEGAPRAAAQRGAFKVGTVRYTSTGELLLDRKAGLFAKEKVATKADWAAAGSAWTLYKPWFDHVSGFQLAETRGVELTADLKGFDLLHMAGHYGFTLTPAEKAALKAYIAGGGTVLFEPVGGRGPAGATKDFYQTAVDLLKELFPGETPDMLTATSPLISGKLPGVVGFDCALPGYSRSLLLGGRPPGPNLRAIKVNGRTAAIVSGFDLSCGIAGIAAWDRRGYTTKSARELTANILMSVKP